MAEVGTGAEQRLRITRTLAASRERIFRAWTEAEAMKRWYAPGETKVAIAEVDLRVGGAWRVLMRATDGSEYDIRGVYREIEPPSRLVFTWKWVHEPAEKETLVTVELRDVAGRTELVLTHERFKEDQDRSNHETGWHACLDNLEKTV